MIPGNHGPFPPDPARLEGELGRARSRAQAQLLAEAAELALASTLEGRLLTRSIAPLPAVSELLARCAVEIDQALADDANVDGELIACCLLSVRDWPPAEVLAGNACRLDDSPVHRLILARAQLAAGRHESARSLLARLEHARLPLIRRAELREAQGLACERAGEPLCALRHHESAAALGAGARASLAALVIALELGREDRAAWAREAIENLEPDITRLAPLLREVIERRALLGRPVEGSVILLASEALRREPRDLTREPGR